MRLIGRAIAWSTVASLLVLGALAGCHGRGALGGTPYYGPGSAPVPAPGSITNNSRPKRLYVANSGSNDIFIANLDPSGAIIPVNTNNIATGQTPLAIAGHPSVNFMVTCNSGSGDLWSYKVDAPTGNLLRTGTPVAVGAAPVGMKWSSNGKYLYVLTNDPTQGPTLTTFDFDTTTLALTKSTNKTAVGNVQGQPGVNPSTGQPGTQPVAQGTATALALAPGGTFAYVAIASPDEMAVVKLAPDGSSTVQGSLVAGGPTQTAIGPYPGGRFVWVCNAGSGDLSQFNLDSNNNLTLNPTPITTGQAPFDIKIDIMGTNAWVVNAQSGDVAQFAIQGPSGTLTPHGNVGAAAVMLQGGQQWQGQGLPDSAQAATGVNAVAMTITFDRAFAYVLNLGVNNPQQPIPPFVTCYSVDNTGALQPLVLPSQAVPNGQNPIGCGGAPGQVFPQPDDITIY